MLQPTRSKFRKAHKGRIHGYASRANLINYGAYALKQITWDTGPRPRVRRRSFLGVFTGLVCDIRDIIFKIFQWGKEGDLYVLWAYAVSRQPLYLT